MTLETMTPDENADVDEAVADVLGTEGLRYLVWGADWCGDCERQLPGFAAALAAAGVPADRIEQFPVDDDKVGEGTDEYDVEFIPTVVVERDGEEVARFVEDEPVTIAEYLADRLAEVDERAEA